MMVNDISRIFCTFVTGLEQPFPKHKNGVLIYKIP